MKSFKKFLKEEEEKKATPLIPAPVRTIKPSVPTTYSDPATGVRSFFHTTPTGESYWGYGVADSTGAATDKPQTGLSSEQKSQISRTARGHMEDFLKSHPEVKKVTYQTNSDAQGELNRKYFKEKMWPEMQKKTGTRASFVEVPKNPLTRSPLAAGAASIGAGIVGGLAAEYVVKPAAEKTGLTDLLAKGISSIIPNSILAAGPSPAEEERENEEASERLKKMGIQSGKLRGPFETDIGK